MTTISTSNCATSAAGEFGLSAQEWKRLSERVVSSFADQLIADGAIKTKGKSKRQIALQALKLVQKLMKNGTTFSMFARYDLDILEEAKKFRDKGRYREACLFYAMWFEHRVNFIVTRERFGLTDDERQQMVREVSLMGKLTWLLPALGFRRLSPANLKTIRQLVEARNAFVHFKYRLNTQDQEDDEENRLRSLLTKVEKARSYFEEYEKKQLYDGLKGFMPDALKGHPEKNGAIGKGK